MPLAQEIFSKQELQPEFQPGQRQEAGDASQTREKSILPPLLNFRRTHPL